MTYNNIFLFLNSSSFLQLQVDRLRNLESELRKSISTTDLDPHFHSPDLIFDLFLSRFRFCVGDKFYLCDNKILCEYDYEERLVFASMANHPILKRHASGSLPNTPPNIQNNIPTSVSSPIQQNGHHHGLMSNIASPRSQNNDMNNNQSGMNGVSSPFGTPTHMKQVITTN